MGFFFYYSVCVCVRVCAQGCSFYVCRFLMKYIRGSGLSGSGNSGWTDTAHSVQQLIVSQSIISTLSLGPVQYHVGRLALGIALKASSVIVLFIAALYILAV